MVDELTRGKEKKLWALSPSKIALKNLCIQNYLTRTSRPKILNTDGVLTINKWISNKKQEKFEIEYPIGIKYVIPILRIEIQNRI